MISTTNFYKAQWSWGRNKLIFTSEIQENLKKETSFAGNILKQKRELVWGPYIQFFDNIDPNRQMNYRRNYLRQVKANIPDIITLQDIKNVVTFTTVGELPGIFIKLFHSKLVDKFLISLIAYFEVYLEVVDDLKWRRKFIDEKLKHFSSQQREKYCSKWLNKIRCRVGQEYSSMLLGIGKFKKFHHINTKIMKSEGIKDVILFECLYKFAARTVWIAMSRKSYTDIEVEVDHLFRTDKFSIVRRRRLKSAISLPIFEFDEVKIIHDQIKVVGKKKLISPATDELFKLSHDFDFRMNHYTDLKDIPLEMPVNYLNAIFIIPEELYISFGISLGILGLPKEDYDLMLQFKEKPIADEVELALIKISEIKIKIIPMYQLYKVLERYESEIVLKEELELNGFKWKFIDLVNILLSNQYEESNKFIKLWLNHALDVSTL